MSVFGWIIVHQHLGDVFDWALPWADYKAGFGDINSDFWLGLERLHLLTSTADLLVGTTDPTSTADLVTSTADATFQHDLSNTANIFPGRSFHLLTSNQHYRLRMEMQQKTTGLWYSAEYWTFQIG